jgi:glycerophosphoryl diester phosphodiesterase
MCSADGEPFVFHDEHLRRTTNGRGQFGLVDAAYLRSLDAGSWFSKRFKGAPIPHFKEALEWLMQSGMQANIEIKPYPGKVAETTVAVLSHIHRYWPKDKALPLVSSFEWDALILCRSIAPELQIGLLFHTWDNEWLKKARQIDCYSIHFNRRILTRSRVASVKAEGYVVCAYTVNWKRTAKKLLGWGVDAVFSDYPDLLK